MPRRPHVVTGFSTPAVTALTGVPPSTLGYWVEIGLVTPSLHPSTGRRATRWWSLNDVLIIRAIRALREAGCSMSYLHQVKERVEEWGEKLSEVHLYWTGSDILVTEPWGTIRSSIKQPGQGVLHVMVIPIAEWHREFSESQDAEDVDITRLRNLARKRGERVSIPVEEVRVPKPPTSLRRSS